MVKHYCTLAISSILLFVALLDLNNAAPHGENNEQLEHQIAEYLKHDKNVVADLKRLGFDDNADEKRVKRQSDIDTNDTELLGQDPKEPGFFDRAAKFVVELLQRFLRWINTDDS